MSQPQQQQSGALPPSKERGSGSRSSAFLARLPLFLRVAELVSASCL